MVYVVERYLPGLSRSDLLRGLSRLERTAEREESGVRYLDSTIVLRDEACYCRFEGPTEAAIAEANRRAGLPFDRIVPAVTVKTERSRSMNVLTTTQATVEIRRGRLFALIAAVALLATAATWALSTYAFDSSSRDAQAGPSVRTSASASLTAKERERIQSLSSLSGLAGAQQNPVTTSGGKQESPIMSMTPAELRAGALGGYALPTVQGGPMLDEVLASMSPATRRYTEKILALTIAQLQAGAAGSP
ncbi:MAG TPA: DUF4242 domain-containing protein [Gaiellaceae bacterium]|nr:DUF4242 domain-containing protein [Gaiellaceae bacterium]